MTGKLARNRRVANAHFRLQIVNAELTSALRKPGSTGVETTKAVVEMNEASGEWLDAVTEWVAEAKRTEKAQ